MRTQGVQWDLSTMGSEELLREDTIFFLAKVLAAASMVAFGPALVLEYVPTSKVDVRDLASAGALAGRTQRLLLAFAGGGLMAEAALHLLPHLFMPSHRSGDGDHHDDGRNSDGGAYTLIAVGFLAAFAIDRLVGVRRKQRDAAGKAEAATVSAPARAAAARALAAGGRGGWDTAPTGDAAVADGVDVSEAGSPISTASAEDGLEHVDHREIEAKSNEEGQGGDKQETPARDVPVISNASVDDELSAAGAMLASAHMMQTPEKHTGEMREPTDSYPEITSPRAPAIAARSLGPAVSFFSAPDTPPELTTYGNQREVLPAAEQAGVTTGAGTDAATDDTAVSNDVVLITGGGGDHDAHHHDHHPADSGAYVTLAVDFLHNMIDGIGIGSAYAVGGDAVGHATACLKLVHEVQHEIGDVATLVQCGMSKHHAIHIQHTTAAGVFLGVAISLGAGAFPEGLLAACLALSAGATFHLASGTVLGPVLAIPADVGGSAQGLLEVAALAAGAAGVVAVGLAEGWAGIGH